MVSKEFVVYFVEQHRSIIEAIEPSFFEITVAMAFVAFADAGVDVAVIETGLGGRLDSTNVIRPELSIITNISLDHTDLLGKTIPEIAFEKAGIIKQGVPVVIGEENHEAEAVFSTKATEMNAATLAAYKHWKVSETDQGFTATRVDSGAALSILTDLKGRYQQHNIATVLTAVDVLNEQGWRLNENVVANALSQVKTLTGLRGRWDVWQEKPFIVADVAHNPAGLSLVMKDWAAVPAKSKHIVLGFVRDKDVRKALSLFPKDAHYHFCAANLPRALPAEELAGIASELGLSGSVYPSVTAALNDSISMMNMEDALLVSGSFFIVGEAMQAYEEQLQLSRS
jgi:dihydrofolate synthase/folylpolyglutamate synthase